MPTPKKKSPRARKGTMTVLENIENIYSRLFELEARFGTLDLNKADVRALDASNKRLDVLEARDCVKAVAECLPERDLAGRLKFWDGCTPPRRITNMDDLHVKNVIQYLKDGKGPWTPAARTDRLEALTFEAGRRAGRKGL